MQLVFKTYFYNVTFYSNMCQVYFIKEKINLFFGEAFEYPMIFML
jgi:hypothetical protein